MNKKQDRDWGKLIFKIVILLFIIFFISRWFAPGGIASDTAAGSETVTVTETLPGDVTEADTEPGSGPVTVTEPEADPVTDTEPGIRYEFRNRNLLDKHYEKHGIEMGFESAEEYEAAASAVINDPEALHKLEQEDGDDVFYLEDTGEFVVLSTDGFIRTYYYADKAYFDRQ
jgi:hypothetical protein